MNSAVINFNTGASRVLNIMEYGIQDGHYTNIFCGKKDEGRIKECFRKQAKWRVQRLEKDRATRKGFGHRETLSYEKTCSTAN